MASAATGVAWADSDSASDSSSSGSQSVSRPDASPSGSSTSKRGKRGSAKSDSDTDDAPPQVKAPDTADGSSAESAKTDDAEADDASPRTQRRNKLQKPSAPSRTTRTDDEGDVEVRGTEAPAVAAPTADVTQAESAPRAPLRTPVATRTLIATSVVTSAVTTPHVVAETEVVELDEPAAPAPDSPAGTGLWTMLSAAGRESRRTLFNRRPVLDNQQVDVTLDEYDDVSAPIAFGGTDADGDPLTYRVARGKWFGPRHGTVTVDPTTGTFTYDADNEFALTGGRDRFLVRVSDYNSDDVHLHGLFGGHSDWAIIKVVVAPTDRAPVAGNDSVSVDEDGLVIVNPADLLANDSDPDGDDLSIDGYSQPEHGDLWINRDGTISYTPDDDFTGTDTFTYTVTDGTKTTSATVTVTVNPVNDAPVATDDAVSVDEDGLLIVNPADLLANDTDVDRDNLSIDGYTQPEHGDLWINRDGTISYNPDDDYTGTDTFTYTVTDGTESATATVTVTVNAVNDAPVATDDAVSVDEDGLLIVNPADLLANDTDVDGDELSVEGYTQPEHGDVWINRDGTISYNPDADFFGTDTFTYTVTDGTESVTATVTVTVNAVNDEPVANNDAVEATEDASVTFPQDVLLGNDTDADGDTLTVVIGTAPANGTLVQNANGTYTYTPNANFNGTDSFTYTVSDGTTTSALATVTITVAAVNDTPAATNDTLEATEDTPLTFTPGALLGNDTDADGDTLTVVIGTAPANGTLVQNANGTYTYTPNANFNGTDTFTYTVSDGTTTSALATVTINVAAVDDGPVATDDTLEATEDTTLTFFPGSLLGNDVNTSGGGTLSVDAFSQPAHGTLVLNADGTFTYTPNANFFGVDSFVYTATDGTFSSEPATVTVNVANVDDAPVITGVNTSSADPTSGAVLGSVTATDPDGGSITYSAPLNTPYGTVTIDPNTGAFVYTPTDDARAAVSGGTTGGTINLTDPSQVTQGTFSSIPGGLTQVAQLTQRGATRNYVATFFTATATQTYTLGQAQAPVDTVMIVYRGTFDPNSPETNAAVLNDDSRVHAVAVTGCGGSASLCPEVSLDLVAGEQVSIVVTTYFYDEPLGLPQSFYSTGPGRFSTTPPEDTFVVTATDSSGATTTVSVQAPITPLPVSVAL
ncbi:MAG: Ig-like domain-containing protein [Mycobacterium kyogaense]|uniref:tandem-95 repeat protein n=1 Tax=Mycobacterium kyogaense TaxID=2212479 RepID=UPI002FF57D5D